MNKGKTLTTENRLKLPHETKNEVKTNTFSNQEKKIHINTLSCSQEKSINKKDFLDIASLVKDSVEKINDLFSQKEFSQTQRIHQKNLKRDFSKRSNKTESLDKSLEVINNKTEKEKNTINATNKTNFTFNINNFINVPQMNNESENKHNDINNNINNNSNNKIYINHIEKINLNNNTELYQIDEYQKDNKTTKKLGKVYNNRIDLSKNVKNVREFRINSSTVRNDQINYTVHSIQGEIKNLSIGVRKKENNNDNTIKAIKKITQCKHNSIRYRNNKNRNDNKYLVNNISAKTNENSNIKKINKPKENIVVPKTKENSNKLQKETTNNTNLSFSDNNNLSNNISIASKEIKSKKYIVKISKQKQTSDKKVSPKKFNFTSKKDQSKTNNISIVEDNKFINISESISSDETPKKNDKLKSSQHLDSISHLRPRNASVGRKSVDSDFSQNGSRAYFHKIVNNFYNKEFPSKINTNDILKLMLFLNEYLLNNNVLNDIYLNENKKILEDYTQYISKKITVDYPEESDVCDIDTTIKFVKIIQRKWRQKIMKNYLDKNKKNEKDELKKFIVNKYIKKSGYKIKKILGLFNTIVENFDNVNKQSDINEVFYTIQKLENGKLTNYEKNLLYKDFINSVIYMK